MDAKWLIKLIFTVCAVAWLSSAALTTSWASTILLPLAAVTGFSAALLSEKYRQQEQWRESAWCSAIIVVSAGVLGPILMLSGIMGLLYIGLVLYTAIQSAKKHAQHVAERQQEA